MDFSDDGFTWWAFRKAAPFLLFWWIQDENMPDSLTLPSLKIAPELTDFLSFY